MVTGGSGVRDYYGRQRVRVMIALGAFAPLSLTSKVNKIATRYRHLVRIELGFEDAHGRVEGRDLAHGSFVSVGFESCGEGWIETQCRL